MEAAPQRTREELMAELRTLIPIMGIRKAARSLGINEDTACSWAVRYGWTDNEAVKEAIGRIQHHRPTVQAGASSGLISAANLVREKVQRVRINHLEASLAASERLAQLSGDELLLPEMADTLLKHGKHAAVVGGWNADTRPDSPGKAFGARQMGLEIDAEADVIVGDVTECEDESQT